MKRILQQSRIAVALAVAAALAMAGCATPGAVDGPAYFAEPVTIGAGGEWELNGVLTMPRGASAASPVPAVVLVQGSGPSNMDLTMPTSGSRPFFDIASHLSANGIAAIRHDKRTYTHGARMVGELGGSLTVWEEAVEDAILAVRILRADPRVSRVYVVGLSLGGMLAPRIHASGGDFDGLVLMAGSPRLLTDIMIEQFRANITAAPLSDAERGALLGMVDALDAQFATIPGMSAAEARAAPLSFLGTPLGMAYYFQEMAAHPFADFVRDTRAPMLVMQGGRDFQILADTNFAMIQELLAGRDNVTFKLYENLNHLFMPSAATDFNEHAVEVALTAGVVDAQAMQDIADWILGRR